jgi:hypothetical protein
MKLGSDDANRLLALIGHLHDAGTIEEIAVVCREGLTSIVPADICDLVVLAGGAPRDDRYIGTPGGYTAAEVEAVLATAFELRDRDQPARRIGDRPGRPLAVAGRS